MANPVAARGVGLELDFGFWITSNDDAALDLTMEGNVVRPLGAVGSCALPQ